MLVLAILVLVFLIFRLSAAEIIHNQAEKRRMRLAEAEVPEEPEPKPEYDIPADLHVLAQPVPKAPKEKNTDSPRRQTNFDLPLGKSGKKRKADPEEQEDQEDPADDLLVFTQQSDKKKKSRQTRKEPEPSPFDIPMNEDYTAQVQKLVSQVLEGGDGSWGDSEESSDPIWEEQPEWTDSDMSDTPEDSDPSEWDEPSGFPSEGESEENFSFADAVALQEPSRAPQPRTRQTQTVSEPQLEVSKTQKLSRGQAAAAAAQVAMEIEARGDEEAQQKPVYQYPPMSMLTEALSAREDNTEEMRTCVRRLEETLESFGVDTKISNVVRGPAVTRYEMELKPGVKMSKITSLHEDIALSLGVTSVHVAAVPGKSSTIGIEVPNTVVTSVPIKEVLGSREFRNHKSALAFALGKDISGNYIIGDIAKMPHLLIAGTTGSGKSVCMNSIIVSLLYRDSPDQCRLIMVDPKVVELSIYNGVPHLLIPVVTDPQKAAGALQWAVTEMDRRYGRFEDARVRDLAGYNKKAEASGGELEPMPRIVIIIDELADLMMVAAKEVETAIARLAAKARAAGMHLVIATQRPSADVITGVIKANIPSRIAFAVSSAMESNIIMGTRGAEKLLGKGDMFYAPQGSDKPLRVQGCFISDEEVEKVAEYVKASAEADYSQEIIQEIEQNASAGAAPEPDMQTSLDDDGDELLPDAVEVILDTKQASVSMLQRRLKLGYAHAARIVDEMEEKGIVGPFEGSKPRQLLITREQWDTMVGINPRAVAAVPEEPDDPPFDE